MADALKPLIVQSDMSLLLETDSPLYPEIRGAIAPFAEMVKCLGHDLEDGRDYGPHVLFRQRGMDREHEAGFAQFFGNRQALDGLQAFTVKGLWEAAGRRSALKGQGMGVRTVPDRRRGPDPVANVDGRPGIRQPEPFARQDVPVAGRVQVAEALGKNELLSV